MPSALSNLKAVEERFWEHVIDNGPDECLGWRKSLSLGYGQFRVDWKLYKAHKVSYEIHFGPVSEGLVVDHKCRNTACSNPNHLQAVTQQKNVENHSGAQSNSKSGIRGVSWDESRSRWIGQVTHKGTSVLRKRFSTKAEAEAAVIAKRNEFFTNNLIDRNVA